MEVRNPAVPLGRERFLFVGPAVETAGYYRTSLRDIESGEAALSGQNRNKAALPFFATLYEMVNFRRPTLEVRSVLL